MVKEKQNKLLDNLGVWLVVFVFITLIVSCVTQSYDILVFIIGITTGYVLVSHLLQKADDEKNKPIGIVNLFFSCSLQDINFDDNDASILETMHKNINNIVQSENFISVNKNSLFNSHKLEIAIYEEIIKEIQNNKSQLKIAQMLLDKATMHLKRLENNDI